MWSKRHMSDEENAAMNQEFITMEDARVIDLNEVWEETARLLSKSKRGSLIERELRKAEEALHNITMREYRAFLNPRTSY